MKRSTIEILLLLGIVLVSIWILAFIGWGVRGETLFRTEGFQVATGSTTASAPPANTQKMLLTVLGPKVAATGGSAIYTSDTGTFTEPTWKKLSGEMKSISGMEGRLYATGNADDIYSTKQGTNYSAGTWTDTGKVGGTLSQVSRDKYAVCGVKSNGEIYCQDTNIEFEKSWGSPKSGKAKWISISNGRLAAISMTNTVVYSPTYVTTSWTDIMSNLGTTRQMKQVVLDDYRITAIDAQGLVYMADLTETGFTFGGVPTAPRWFQVNNPLDGTTSIPVRFIEMRMGRVLVIGRNNNIYYSDDYRSGTWSAVPLPPVEEVYAIGKYTFAKVDAAAKCKLHNGRLATKAELDAAYAAGASWCKCAWIANEPPVKPYACSTWTAADKTAITANGGNEKLVCESVAGRIYSKGDETKAPGCGTCWCCQPAPPISTTAWYPNNDDTQSGCSGPEPKMADCGMPAKSAVTCYGVKPDKTTADLSPFNTTAWNAPIQSVEFVPFSTVPLMCGTEGALGTYKGTRFRYYTRDECTSLGARQVAIDGRNSEYNAATGECRITTTDNYVPYIWNDADRVLITKFGGDEKAVCEGVPGRIFTGGDETLAPGCIGAQCCQPPAAPAKPPISFSRACLGQDRPNQTLPNIWDDGSSGMCAFNKIKYATKYGLTDQDTGTIYDHLLTTGVDKGYSPCGDINDTCRWDADTYLRMNPSVAMTKIDPLTHYKTIGVKKGLAFCQSINFYPLLDSLKNVEQKKGIISPPKDITDKCSSTVYAGGVANFEQKETFLYKPLAQVTKMAAGTICAAFGGDTRLATLEELTTAQINGADWCNDGWVSDDVEPKFPVNGSFDICGGGTKGIKRVVLTTATRTTAVSNVTCYGVKPANVLTGELVPFNKQRQSMYSISIAAVPTTSTLPEVFWYSPTDTYSVTKVEADSKCRAVGAVIATTAQVTEAQQNGADWCVTGWVFGSLANAIYPLSTYKASGCGTNAPGIQTFIPPVTLGQTTPSVAGVNCYGVKPVKGTMGVRAFNTVRYSRYDVGSSSSTGGTPTKQWVCSSKTWSDKLFQGPGTSDQTYLDKDDSVCYTNDEKTKMYYCKSVKDDMEGADYTANLMDNYDTTCNNLVKGYNDLSGAIATLARIQAGMTSGTTNVNTAKNDIQSVYDRLGCNTVTPSNTGLHAMCAQIQTSILSLTSSATNIATKGVDITTPIAGATASRSTLLASLTNFGCSL